MRLDPDVRSRTRNDGSIVRGSGGHRGQQSRIAVGADQVLRAVALKNGQVDLADLFAGFHHGQRRDLRALGGSNGEVGGLGVLGQVDLFERHIALQLHGHDELLELVELPHPRLVRRKVLDAGEVPFAHEGLGGRQERIRRRHPDGV